MGGQKREKIDRNLTSHRIQVPGNLLPSVPEHLTGAEDLRIVTILAEYTASTGFLILAYIAIAALAMLVLVSLFGPGLGYKIEAGIEAENDSDAFLHMLEALVDAKVCRNTKLTVLTNGRHFYENELAVISTAHHSIN